jgi:HlyD family secretion protein
MGRSQTASRLSLIAVAVVAAIAVAAAVVLHRPRPTPAGPDIQYETVHADRGPIVAKVTASGTVSALVTVQVGSQVSGRVQAIYVDYNSTVKAGEVIARLDPLLFQAAVDQSSANYLTAQSALKTAQAQEVNTKLQYERSQSLLARSLVAQSDFDAAKAAHDASVAQVDGATSGVALALASLNQAKVNLGYATIVSPIDGTVVSRSVDVGQTVASAFQAPVLFTIAKDLREMQVDTSVSEADVGRLLPGMPATFTVDAYPDEPFSGTVRQVRNAATTVQNVVTYDAVIDVHNPALKLKPGMTANVTLVVAHKDRALRAPNAAVRFQPDAALLRELKITVPEDTGDRNRKWLWVLHEGRPVAALVETGISDGTLTEVVSGDVYENDVLITDMAETPKKRFGLF